MERDSPTLATTVAAVLVEELPAGAPTPIDIEMAPNAECTLRPEGAAVASSLQLFADDRGTVRFHVQPGPDADASTRLSLDCRAEDGSHALQPIELRATAEAASTTVAAVHSSRSNELGGLSATLGEVRPPLTGDVMLPTPQELFARGFPPRPDPVRAPSAYQAWLHAVSRPSVRVTPRYVERADHPNGPVVRDRHTNGSTNWSGYSTPNPAPAIWDLVLGSWLIPSVSGDTRSSFTSAYSAVWAGLDGIGTQDVVQDGTEGDAFVSNGFTTATYYPWFQYYPGMKLRAAGFPANPGDAIFTEVYVGDAFGNLNPQGGFGWFYLENDSVPPNPDGTSVYFYTSSQAPAGVRFAGTSAEWIIERPAGLELSNYGGGVTIWNNLAQDSNGIESNLSSNPKPWTMYNGSHVLSTATNRSFTEVAFGWHAFN